MRKPGTLLASLVVILFGAFAAMVLGGKPDAALARHPLVTAGFWHVLEGHSDAAVQLVPAFGPATHCFASQSPMSLSS